MRQRALCVATLACFVWMTKRAAAECSPAAVPIGDPALVQRVSEKLAANGVATVATAGCPAVRVHLEKRGEQLHLRVADGYQRRGEREVQDIATAAAVIESWTLQEIEDGTLPETPTPSVTAAVAPLVQRERFAIAVAGQFSVAGDGSTWLGGELAGCVRIGWACVGASTAFLANTSTTADTTRGSQRSKELHALATLEVPRTLGSFTISPGIGIGYGWMTFAEQHMDVVHMLPVSVEYSSHALHARAQLAVSRSLGGRLALVGSLFGDIAALRSSIPDGPTSAPRGRVGFALGLRLGLR
ncbi:MAG: hypothetical protein M4D80_15675 [Myxococcota bacterium]|nr:hypothetical protein [Myxococcota bacterium]